LAGIGGCASPGVRTFAQFAEGLLAAAPEPVRPITALMKRHLVRRLLEAHRVAGRLKHFGPIATTSGLVDLVCDFLGELKRQEIWPDEFRQACRSWGAGAKDEDLLALYEAYQACLVERHLYDAEGRFWSARDRLRQMAAAAGKGVAQSSGSGNRDCPQRWRLVVADGFNDFTRTEHEILETLAGLADEVWISLALEPEPRREDLFQRPLRTLSELLRRHPEMTVEEVGRPPRTQVSGVRCQVSVPPALAHLERTLFVNPRQAEQSDPPPVLDGIEILAAGRQLGEITCIAERIKLLLSESEQAGGEPVRPGQVAVVFRHPQEVGELVREVFQRLGIPVALETGRLLGQWPALVTLANLLRQDDEVASPGAEGDRAVVAGASGQSPSRQAPAALLAELPHRGSLAEWAAAWQRLARRAGLLQGTDGDAAWSRLWQCFDECGRLDRWLGREGPTGEPGRHGGQARPLNGVDPGLTAFPRELDRRAAVATLLDLLGSQTVVEAGDEAGRVRVLSAAAVRGLRIPYLFLAGLSEKSFPSPDRADRLYGEAERRRLIEEGLPLASRADRQADEMLLFYQAVTAATTRLWLSYPAVNDSGEPLSPSPYLREVEQACGQGRLARSERLDLSPVPEGEPLSAEAFRLSAVASALAGDAALLAGLLRYDPATAEGILAGLDILALRQDRRAFGAAEGMLGPAAQAPLAAAFSPERLYSVTELELYACCPYRYFLERLLKVSPVEDLKLRIDFAERGRLMHEFLAEFHRRLNRREGRPTSPAAIAEEDYRRLAEETLEAVMATEGEQKATAAATLPSALQEINRRKLRQWIDQYRAEHERYDRLWADCQSPLRPELVEVAFGRPQKEKGDSPHLPERPATNVPSVPGFAQMGTVPFFRPPLEMTAAGEVVRLAGRIDRIDTGLVAGRTAFNVLDYKTGGAVRLTAESIARGLTLQLPVYARAVSELALAGPDTVGWRAGYWHIGDDGFKPRQALALHQVADGKLEPTPEWEAARGGLARTIVGLVRGIRAGQFPVSSADPECTGTCPFKTVCRINHVRALEKTWEPPVA